MAVAAARMQSLHQVARSAENERMTSCYRSFGVPLRAFLARHTRSIHDAEDLAQEVFLRMWRVGTHSEIHHLKALVFKTANNLLKDRSRRTYTRMMRNAVSTIDLELPDVTDEPSSLLESLQTLSVFTQTLADLRPSTRTAFLLYRFESYSHTQIAAQMAISVSMVEKHVSYAMAALRSAGIECNAIRS
jgi:RNA polymerase sigma factor (sigma-70 family)